ncbi:chorismate mutase [Listeria aquatica]|uniref:chorismate mutase n=1 Tax=Listeria aquatica TaxID=1494960 RepID=A0A841ZMW3_9LIST|nr:chorismate mutase [Listeria aquatica]MBC1520525.1 chorismate mutase [Listeria aquatica]
MRAIRGATTVKENQAEEIYAATDELFRQILRENELTDPEHLVSVIITATPDLNAAFPARAIRECEGFQLLPVMGMVETDVPGAPAKCIRLMVHAQMERQLADVKHVYLNDAAKLRPDLARKRDEA